MGSTLALEESDYICTLHRNLGVFTTRNVPLEKLFAQWFGKAKGFTKGRDRSFHFGSKEHAIIGMISHLGPQLNVGDGLALATKLNGSKKVVLAFSGDGGASEGDFHEALNIASVWNLPIIFAIENNGYGLSTPSEEQFVGESLAVRGESYGIPSRRVDGNNILEVFTAVSEAAERIRKKPHPELLEFMTFRIRGHEEASGTAYINDSLIEDWKEKDPVHCFRDYLIKTGFLSETREKEIAQELTDNIEAALKRALDSPSTLPSPEKELSDIFAPFQKPRVPQTPSPSTSSRELRFVDAVSEALYSGMTRHKDLLIMGQDIAEYGGVFKITEGFLADFGKERVRNTPLCESGILAMALGLSVEGYKSIIEMQFADFITSGFTAVVNALAKTHYRWGQHVDTVIRMPTGGSVGAGPFHSQCTEAWFHHTPGLKIAFPSNPYDAKGLLLTAIEDPNPVLFFEHKALYRGEKGEVPKEDYFIPFGRARLVETGEDLSIITYGLGVRLAGEAVRELGINADIVDLRTLCPMDYDSIRETIKKTGKVLLITEACLTGSVISDLAAWISEHCFKDLDAPVMRVGALDTPVPFAKELEKQFLPDTRLREMIVKLKNW